MHYLLLTLFAGAAAAVCSVSAAAQTAKAADTPVDKVRAAIEAYDLDLAERLIDDMEAANRRNRRKNPLPAGLDDLRSQIDRVRDMMDRVARIEVIDSVTVSRADFQRAYGLLGSELRSGATCDLAHELGVPPQSVFFTSEGEETAMWAARDASGHTSLMMAERLADGSYTPAAKVKGELGEDADFPFLMADGVTLYYSAQDPDGLGGYDILMTRREGDGFLLPQNMGMPYNSPGDDLLLAIDEERGLGWWATDRGAAPGKVTVYTFIPTEVRSNYPSDTPGLAGLARLTSIKATQTPGKDYGALLRKMDVAEPVAAEDFYLAVPGRGVLTSLSQFRNARAAELMGELLDLQDRRDYLAETLSANRRSYGAGNKDLRSEILAAESELEKMDASLARLTNEVVRAESQP